MATSLEQTAAAVESTVGEKLLASVPLVSVPAALAAAALTKRTEEVNQEPSQNLGKPKEKPKKTNKAKQRAKKQLKKLAAKGKEEVVTSVTEKSDHGNIGNRTDM